jgi:hypothetical protein
LARALGCRDFAGAASLGQRTDQSGAEEAEDPTNTCEEACSPSPADERRNDAGGRRRAVQNRLRRRRHRDARGLARRGLDRGANM